MKGRATMVFGKKALLLMGLLTCLFIPLYSVNTHASGFSFNSADSAASHQTLVTDTATGLIYSKETTSGQAVTLSSTVKFNMDWDSDNSSPIVLLGLGDKPTGIPSALAVAWIQDTSAWVPRWQLVLAGSLRTGPPNTAMSTSVFGLDHLTVAAKVEPTAGHTYATALSYNPANGAMSYSVTDITSRKTIAQSGETESGATFPLYPAAGAVSANPAAASTTFSVENISMYTQYLPVGSTWEVGVGTEHDRAASWLFTGDEPGYLQLDMRSDLPAGEFRLTLQHDAQTTILTSIHPSQPTTITNLAVETLPLGKSTLQFDYIANGRIWMSSSQDIVVGSVSVAFDNVAVNQATHRMHTVFNAHSNRELTGLPISIEATTSQLVWDPTNRLYLRKPVSRSVVYTGNISVGPNNGTNSISTEVPVPAEPGLWEVKLSAFSTSGVAVKTSGERQVFHTYAPVMLEPDKPFTVAVLPDTQLYTRTDKPIFMRMTQWIAENAAAKHIGLVLHMGDITEQNRPNEWNTSVESLYLLNGVTPYVLAVGNHDLLRPEDGYTVNDYNGSLINQYFPASLFPALAGTFTPNRIENAYYSFKFNKQDYLILSLEYAPRPQVLNWANDIVETHPNHKVIVITHAYLNRVGNREMNGDSIWWNLIRLHKNVLMVLCGHIPADTVPYLISRGVDNNLVYQLLFDYQAETNGGNGYLGLLEFTSDNNINVQVYSPYLGQYKTDHDMFSSSSYQIKVGESKVVEH